MTLDQYRSHVKVYFDPLVAVAIKCRLTPNFFTIAALLASAAAGALFFQSMLLWGIIAVALNAFCDAMDGAVAREMKIQSKRGDFLDHAVDRYADIFIICGLFAGGMVPWQIGVFALTGVLMSSYLGTQAQAVGVGRYYGGILGRADRLVMIMVARSLRHLRPLHGVPAVRVRLGEGGVILFLLHLARTFPVFRGRKIV
jgi:archaetidylinositol phosphate synthase